MNREEQKRDFFYIVNYYRVIFVYYDEIRKNMFICMNLKFNL